MINNTNKHDSLNDQLLTVRQAAEYLKCSTVFIYLRRKEGKIKALTVGTKKVLIPKESLDCFIKLNEIKVTNG